ncbi:hypothetical protein [Ornithinimicrobium kibberense]|uniref:hypothetical protein n=1 Tax=Ornithinimicrobium kibberense TaxID=282060 RepID=UPI00361A0374
MAASTAALTAGAGAGVEGCPAHSMRTSPWVRWRSAAALSTSITWKGSTADRRETRAGRDGIPGPPQTTP